MGPQQDSAWDTEYIKRVHCAAASEVFKNMLAKTNNLDLFIYTLGQMLYIFFASSHPNYARWMVKYFLNLANVDSTHLGSGTLWRMEHSL